MVNVLKYVNHRLFELNLSGTGRDMFREIEKSRTPNKRFGVMAAATPQKRQYKFETLYLAATAMEAATTPSRRDVVGNAAKSRNRIETTIEY